MAREALATEDHVPPDGAGNHGDDGPGPQGVHHEVLGKQLANVAAEVPAQAVGSGHGVREDTGHHGWEAWRSLWWAGASGWPTTTSRPSDVRSTSMGVPYRS